MAEPKSAFELVTPEKAKAWLRSNKNNRPLNGRHLLYLVAEIQRNNFHTNGDSIKISTTGELLDGQHRLQAIVDTKASLHMFVVRGLDKKSFKYMDIGKNRTAGDILAIENVENPQNLSSMAKFILSFDAGKYGQAAGGTSKMISRITNSDISKFVSKNLDALQESRNVGYHKENKLFHKATLSGLHFIFTRLNINTAKDFCQKCIEGDSLSKDSPIYMLRTRMLADIQSRRKMGPTERIALICKAWNYVRKKSTSSRLEWREEESFPTPI